MSEVVVKLNVVEKQLCNVRERVLDNAIHKDYLFNVLCQESKITSLVSHHNDLVVEVNMLALLIEELAACMKEIVNERPDSKCD